MLTAFLIRIQNHGRPTFFCVLKKKEKKNCIECRLKTRHTSFAKMFVFWPSVGVDWGSISRLLAVMFFFFFVFESQLDDGKVLLQLAHR